MKITHNVGEERRIEFSPLEQRILTGFFFTALAGVGTASLMGLALLVMAAF